MARGLDFIIKVNTGTIASPTWTTVAAQRGGTLKRDADTLDLTTKDSAGWQELDYGLRSWGIEADGLLVENDAGYLALENAYMTRTKVQVFAQTAAGSKYQGMAVLKSFPIEMPYDDSATYKVTFEGSGALQKI
ncbi:phage major tail protein, TP901-1 family [Ectobacillus ponti]|uniref:Phage major tail protein, TP901-1 family n=1 Tax=Ectobacillus ponti TaxID=2961894 RepID=A0AA42BR47_9BACI|nr:phage major tail protein, TP901-1 family [Ectobacillus ponti]MCP8970572.1 phage major tail protein, TP901-1 family [Ectobacillus ponti]